VREGTGPREIGPEGAALARQESEGAEEQDERQAQHRPQGDGAGAAEGVMGVPRAPGLDLDGPEKRGAFGDTHDGRPDPHAGRSVKERRSRRAPFQEEEEAEERRDNAAARAMVSSSAPPDTLRSARTPDGPPPR